MNKYEYTLQAIIKLTLIVCITLVVIHMLTAIAALDSSSISSRNINLNIKLSPKDGTVTK